MAQITVEITQWLRVPTSSLSQDITHYSTLNFFHSKKTTPPFQMKTPKDSAPASSHRVHNPSREPSGWVWGPVTTGRAPGRHSGCPSISQSKSQEPGSELSLWVNQMDSLEAADCSSVPLTSLTSDEQLKLSFFISKQGQWHLIHMFWEIKPPIYSINVISLHSSLTMNGHVLWTQDRKLLRGHSGHWVCDQKQDPRM